MSKPLAFGLNLSKKPASGKPKAGPASRKKATAFGSDDDSDNENRKAGSRIEDVGGELDDFNPSVTSAEAPKEGRSRPGKLTEPPKLKSKIEPNAMFGDLSSSLLSRRKAEAATELDSSVYEYDSVYDSLKPKKTETKEDVEKKPKYMRNLLQAAEVRKRDALVAEEKKIAREREAEGDEFADKEKFVTEAYKKQQEENRRLEEEEKRREEEESRKNKGGGMSAFYRNMLDKDEEKHANMVKAAEERAKQGGLADADDEDQERGREEDEAHLARELNEKGASVAINEDGQVVDKRQLLKGGLNVGAKKRGEAEMDSSERHGERERKNVNTMAFGKKQAMRERQTRMMEEQLEQSLKRSREAEETQRQEAERAAKSRKTAGEISSAKERYLARKRAAEEAKGSEEAS